MKKRHIFSGVNKKKIFFAAVCLITVLVLSFPFGIFVSAETEDDPALLRAYSIVEEIIGYKMKEAGADSIQSLVDHTFSASPNGVNEWYVLALSQYCEDVNFDIYSGSLERYLEKTEIKSASTRERSALVLAATGARNSFIPNTLKLSTGKLGIVSYIFALHLVSNKYTDGDADHTSKRIIDEILQRYTSDGGFAVNSKTGDIDTTAMVIQALSVYRDEPGVAGAIERALGFLSEMQSEDGEYFSYGKNNAESTAQVIIALSSLGIDVSTDERFIKNQTDLFDVLERYRLPGGSFCHTVGGARSESATYEALCAGVAYIRMREGKAPFYILDRCDPEGVAVDLESETDTHNEKSRDEEKTEKSEKGYKPIAVIGVIICDAVACILLMVLKKKRIGNYIFVLIITVFAIVFILLTDFSSPGEYYNGKDAVKDAPTGSVTLSINCDKVAGMKDHIPADGAILARSEFIIEDGDTVYDILVEAARKYKIQLDHDGAGYIRGIGYLYEFDFGDLSGWTFLVNGETVSVGCGEYKLTDGDVIEWRYTLELGKDLE